MWSKGPDGRCAVVWRSALAALVVLLAMGAPSAVAEPGRIDVRVLVCHAAAEAGAVDPGCGKLHGKIGREFRYESLKRLSERSLSLGLDQVGSVVLPNGKRLRVRPLQVDGDSALLAVDVEGSVKTDVRVRKGKSVVIGAERYENGKLVISLEPRW